MRLAVALRDIHQPPAPPLWPPAPGWWLLFAAVATVVVVAWALQVRRRRRRRRIEALFDTTVAHAGTPSQSVAAMSELLRRAARRGDPSADRLQGDAGLAMLGKQLPPGDASALDPSRDAGRLLLDGGFRADVAQADVDALQPLARRVYLSLMARAPRQWIGRPRSKRS